MEKVDKRHSKEMRIRRENVFHITRLLALVLFVVSALAIAQGAAGDRWAILRFNIYLLILMLWQWSTSLATYVCRRLGLSLDGTTVEKIEEANGVDFVTRSIEKPFIVSRQGGQYIMPVCTTLMCFICIGPSLFTKPHTLEYFGHTIMHVLAFSIVAATAIYSWRNIRKPLVKVDAHGISYCDAVGVTSRSVEWEQLSSCDVVRVTDVFGKVIRESVVLRDAHDKKLFTVWINSSSKDINAQNTERFINVIKTQLTGAPSVPYVEETIVREDESNSKLSHLNREWLSTKPPVLRIETQFQLPVWDEVVKQKVINYWSSRSVVFTEISPNVLRGKRGSYLGNLILIDLKNLMSELMISVSGNNEMSCVLEVNTEMVHITKWNRAWWDLEMETFESFLLRGDLQEDKWKSAGIRYLAKIH